MDTFIDFIKKYKKELIIVTSTSLITFLLCFGIFSLVIKDNSKEKSTQALTKTNTVTYVASKNSDKYHLSSCKWAENIKKSNKITFSSESKAKSKGYSPCKTCIN